MILECVVSTVIRLHGGSIGSCISPALQRPPGSTYWVGGDYYAVFGLDPLKVLVGDAVGKRQPAAFLVFEIHGYLKKLLTQAGPLQPGRLLQELNICMVRPGLDARIGRAMDPPTPVAVEFSELRLMTMLAAEYDAGNRLLRWASAGHPAPLILPAKGKIRNLRAFTRSGPQLGQHDHASYEESSTHLEPGDTAVFYTDGMYEDLPEFDDRAAEDRFESAVIETAREASDLPGIIRLLFERLDLERPSQIRQDDATIVLLRAEG